MRGDSVNEPCPVSLKRSCISRWNIFMLHFKIVFYFDYLVSLIFKQLPITRDLKGSLMFLYYGRTNMLQKQNYFTATWNKEMIQEYHDVCGTKHTQQKKIFRLIRRKKNQKLLYLNFWYTIWKTLQHFPTPLSFTWWNYTVVPGTALLLTFEFQPFPEKPQQTFLFSSHIDISGEARKTLRARQGI